MNLTLILMTFLKFDQIWAFILMNLKTVYSFKVKKLALDKMKKVFRDMDADGNGMLTKQEFVNACAKNDHLFEILDIYWSSFRNTRHLLKSFSKSWIYIDHLSILLKVIDINSSITWLGRPSSFSSRRWWALTSTFSSKYSDIKNSSSQNPVGIVCVPQTLQRINFQA